jgi:hypothetical protein
MILGVTGSIAVWGAGAHGELGLDDAEFVEKPQIIQVMKEVEDDWDVVGEPIPEVFTSVSASVAFSAALDERGNVWVWGGGAAGELGGLDTELIESREPIRMHPEFPTKSPRQRTLSEVSDLSVSSMDGLVGTPRLGVAFDQYHGRGASDRVKEEQLSLQQQSLVGSFAVGTFVGEKMGRDKFGRPIALAKKSASATAGRVAIKGRNSPPIAGRGYREKTQGFAPIVDQPEEPSKESHYGLIDDLDQPPAEESHYGLIDDLNEYAVGPVSDRVLLTSAFSARGLSGDA